MSQPINFDALSQIIVGMEGLEYALRLVIPEDMHSPPLLMYVRNTLKHLKNYGNLHIILNRPP